MMKHLTTIFCLIVLSLFGCKHNQSVEQINPAIIIGEWRYIEEHGNSEAARAFNDTTVYDCFYFYGKISYMGAEQYSYSILNDSLIINYEYGDNEYKILKLTEDSLILQNLTLINSLTSDNPLMDYSIEKYYRLNK